MAPEGGLRGSHTDVWGFATTVLHLATGHLPYPGLTHWQIMFAMSNRHLPEVPSSLPEWLQEALRSCLSFDTAARTSVSQLLQVRCARQTIVWTLFIRHEVLGTHPADQTVCSGVSGSSQQSE